MIKTRIWEIRTEQGITLTKLSKLTGISKSALNNYENDKRSPTIKQLDAIANALNVDIVYIITRKNKQVSTCVEIESKNMLNLFVLGYNSNQERVGAVNMKNELLQMINHMLDKLDVEDIKMVYDFIHHIYIGI